MSSCLVLLIAFLLGIGARAGGHDLAYVLFLLAAVTAVMPFGDGSEHWRLLLSVVLILVAGGAVEYE